jgi:tetratricopeptide (TPR) repeat protein
LDDSRTALQLRNLELAEKLAARVPRRDELWPAAQVVAGDAAMRRGDALAAANYFHGVPRDGSAQDILAVFSLGELARDGGRLFEAEREYRYVLKRQPDHIMAHIRLAFVLGATGRRWESGENFLALLRLDAADLEELVLLADLERRMEHTEFLRSCRQKSPDDILVQLAVAADELEEGHSTDARTHLQAVVDRAPDLVVAHAMLGELLVDGDDAEFLAWHAALPPTANQFVGTWLVRGMWARRHQDLRVAARCFWEAVRLGPSHRRANYHLGQVVVALGETSGSEFSERANALYKLTHSVDDAVRSKGQDESNIQRIVELMESVGRYWEACGWAAWAGKTFPGSVWPREVFDRLLAQLTRDTPQTIAAADLTRKYDLSGYPTHEGLVQRISRGKSADPVLMTRSSVRFAESAEVGLDFIYENGHDPSIKGGRMFETTGGGVAVFDFDGDGWPDLFFSQGGEWRTGAAGPSISGETTDRLYRNVGGERFVDVTRESRLVDHDFGQGCAAGDYDNDGFPDLYIANVGRNRLQHNNGDGTFADVTNACGDAADTWTTSCLIADLNADGHPDLFDVTYLGGEGVYEKTCGDHSCHPRLFPGVRDRLFLSRGDGTFEFVPNATPDTDNSKGMGIVAVEFSDRRRPFLFIANDQVPNFFLRNAPAEETGNIHLADEAFERGLAYNTDGLALASMGIAADDANGDGRIDFFVTNFKEDPKVLYFQDAGGIFIDASNTAGLRAVGLPFVAWGTQFLDADRDGEPDLVVTNGHVDDYRPDGGEYHMRPQLFRNTGNGRFVELTPAECGSWFGGKYLGRGLARLDWNRDGRMDFVVSQIGDRAALLTNASSGVGQFLNVRLHARETARDAIGSVVEVAARGRRWVKQLVAGDGYMASNDRFLQFGLGNTAAVKELLVRWPSGATTAIRNPPVNVTLELIEGSARGVLWRGSRPVAATFPIESGASDD